jgi:GTP-sensing pleiotropic transcriptional regulator CodY
MGRAKGVISMSLRAALDAEKAAARKGPPCSFEAIFARLDKADADALTAYLADRENITTTVILRALQAEGFSIGQNTVQRHRKGICTCGRT